MIVILFKGEEVIICRLRSWFIVCGEDNVNADCRHYVVKLLRYYWLKIDFGIIFSVAGCLEMRI